MDIKHDVEGQRFHAAVSAGTVTLDYTRPDELTLDIRSTFVPPAARGAGLGAEIVLHVMNFARKNGLRVIPSCPFVPRVLDEHPGYEDLVVRR